MPVSEKFLSPKVGEGETFAIEELLFSVQIALQKSMVKAGISNKELAEKLGMTPSRVSQVFSGSGPNLTLKTVARIAHALGEDFEFVKKGADEQKQKAVSDFALALVSPKNSSSVWKEKAANDSNFPESRLAA